MSGNGSSSPPAKRRHKPLVAVRPRAGAIALIALLVSILLATPGPATAQIAPAPPATVSVQELDSLIQTLENDKSRAEFVRNLKTILEAQRVGAKGSEATADNWLAQFSGQLRTAVGGVAALGSGIDVRRFATWVRERIADPGARQRGFEDLLKIIAIVASGIATFVVIGFLLKRPRAAIDNRAHMTIISQLFFAFLRLMLDVIPLAAGAGLSLAVAGLIEPRALTRLIALAFVNALVASQLLTMIARFVLAPRQSNLRILPFSDETAYYLYIWICRLGYVALYGYFALEAFLLMGLSMPAYGVLINLLGLVIALLLVIFILQNRETVSANIRGTRETEGQWTALRRPLAAVWHLLAIFYVVALYLVLSLRGTAGTGYIIRGTVLTAVVLFLVWALDGAVRSITQRGFKIAEDIQARFPGLQTKVNRYTTAINIALRSVIGALASATILEAWGVGVFNWIASPIGQRIASATISIVVIVALAFTTWELVSSLIERRLTAATPGRGISTRALTLLPLARTVLRLILIVLVTLVVLAEVGMNITPLLAGAGVIGLAVGFGAQKLVQDVITGWFILMEDTISVGDFVDLDGHAGLVERINIRTIQLRDAEGSVHTIPFSSVTTVKNMTRDFSFYMLDISVAYHEDVDEVIGVLREIDEEMRKDPEFGPAIIEPLDVLGLERFGESEIVIRARTKTRPSQQWRVGREFNRRIKKAFDAHGIEIPYPHRTVYISAAKDANLTSLGGAPEREGQSAEADQTADKNVPRTTD